MASITVVFFDGFCNLCNSFVDRVIRLDRNGVVRFGSLQGNAAKELLGAEADGLASLIVVREGDVYRGADAVIQVGLALGGTHALGAKVFGLFPSGLRNFIYRFIARNRYRLFGRRDTCRVPTAEERARFLD